MSSIFKPVFKGAAYQGHECSECKKRIEFSHISALGFYDMDIRYCPYCGKDIVRFDETPKFEEPLDTSVLEPMREVINEAHDRINWIYWCCFSNEQQNKCKILFEFSSEYPSIRKIKDIVSGKPHHTQITKLNNRFSKIHQGGINNGF